jgi:quercetin dioxygenase-like cupin family protein
VLRKSRKSANILTSSKLIRGIPVQPIEEVRTMTEEVKDSDALYEVERRAYHAARPGFRIAELQISPTQKVPWHYHNNVNDTFYVVEGTIRIFLQQPKEDVRLARGQTFSVAPKRPHLVTNAGETSAVFLVLQGIGEYDFVPLT